MPTELGLLKNLTKVLLDSNVLTGHIPSEMGMLLNLERMDLSSNELQGSIPDLLGDIPSLQFLNVKGNPQLSGTVVPELCVLTLRMDCSDLLCGCDCNCVSEKETNQSDRML